MARPVRVPKRQHVACLPKRCRPSKPSTRASTISACKGSAPSSAQSRPGGDLGIGHESVRLSLPSFRAGGPGAAHQPRHADAPSFSASLRRRRLPRRWRRYVRAPFGRQPRMLGRQQLRGSGDRRHERQIHADGSDGAGGRLARRSYCVCTRARCMCMYMDACVHYYDFYLYDGPGPVFHLKSMARGPRVCCFEEESGIDFANLNNIFHCDHSVQITTIVMMRTIKL